MRQVQKFGVGLVLLIAGFSPALGADVPVKAPLMKAPAVHDWTGWYGGLNYGSAVAQMRGTNAAGTIDRAGTGYSVGVQGGYNWQFDPHWVGGVEADINWLGIDRTFQDWGGDGNFGVKTDWYGTIRGRVGYSSSPSLFYVTGGGAFVNVENRRNAVRPSETAGGWTAGWGIETMLGGNWTARSEYLYIDAGSQTVTLGTTHAFENRFHVFRKALNYRFGGSGTPAGSLPAYNWTGFYIGVNAGTVAAQAVNITTPGFTGSLDLADTGFAGGAQVGYNWQLMPAWIGGVEADVGWLDAGRRVANFGSTFARHGIEANWYSTARARLGFSTGPALLYVTGGAAFVRVKNHYDSSGTLASNSEVATGWTAGGGLEAALGNGWSATTEYLYIDAGGQDVFNPTGGDTTHFNNRFHIFKFGLNRKFGT